MGVAKHMYGAVNIDTTIKQLPCLYGGITALFLPGFLTVIISFLAPSEPFDWEVLKQAKLLVEEDDGNEIVGVDKDSSSVELQNIATDDVKVEKGFTSDAVEAQPEIYRNGLTKEQYEQKSNRYIKWAWIYAVLNLLVTQVLWPLPLYRNYVFTKSFFKGWVVVSIMTTYATFIAVGIYPLWDGRHSLLRVFRGIRQDFKQGNWKIWRKGKE